MKDIRTDIEKQKKNIFHLHQTSDRTEALLKNIIERSLTKKQTSKAKESFTLQPDQIKGFFNNLSETYYLPICLIHKYDTFELITQWFHDNVLKEIIMEDENFHIYSMLFIAQLYTCIDLLISLNLISEDKNHYTISDQTLRTLIDTKETDISTYANNIINNIKKALTL